MWCTTISKRKEDLWLYFLFYNAYFGIYLGYSDTEETTTQQYNVYIQPTSADINQKYINSVYEAEKYWQDKDNTIFKNVNTQEEAHVLIQSIKEFNPEHIGQAFGPLAQIGLGDSYCIGKYRNYNYDTFLKIAKHELGHVIGYNHSNDINNIMYPKIDTKYEIDIEESDILSYGVVRWYPVCTRREKAEYSIEVNSDERLDIYVVPSLEDAEDLASDRTFTEFRGCRAKGVTSYKKKCTVNSGSYVVLTKYIPLDISSEEELVTPAQFTIKIKEL